MNTDRTETENRGMYHTEGGWPKDIALDDMDQLKRYRKKVEKDDLFVSAMYKIGNVIEEAINWHTAMNIYHENVNVSQESFSKIAVTDDNISMNTTRVLQ